MSDTTASPEHPSNGNGVAHPDPIMAAWQRYQIIKGSDNEKNKLIEELLFRYEWITSEHKKALEDLEREKDYNRTFHRGKKDIEEEIYTLRKSISRDPFVLVLIDGDGMVFHDQLLNEAEAGGRRAATMLHDSVDKYVHEISPDLPGDVKVVARIYANVQGLADACHKAGVVPSVVHVEEFVKGFTRGRILFDFIDVGPGKDRADEKISEILKLHAYDLRCRHIVFGCSHDNGFARLLENYIYEEPVRARITLLEGVPFEKELAILPFEKQKFGTMFRSSKLNVLQSGPPAWAILNATALRALNDGNRTPSESVSSDGGASKALPNSWASKAAAAAIIPDTPPQSKVTPSSPTSTTGIPRNRKGQRVDPTIKYDKTEVDRVRKMKMCNVHYLRQECPYGDKCTHKHDRKPTKQELEWLKVVARMAACRNGSGCDDPKCIYGHRCQAPERLDKAKFLHDGGKSCIFGPDCVFPAELHSMDTGVVKMTKV